MHENSEKMNTSHLLYGTVRAVQGDSGWCVREQFDDTVDDRR